MARDDVFHWGNARRQLEAELAEARQLREQYEKKENEVLESLKALDITIDTLNKLPEGVGQLVLMALKANSAIEYAKTSKPPAKPEVKPVVRPTKAASKVERPMKHKKAFEREIATNKPQIYALLHTDKGTTSADIAYILRKHITTVSKVLAAGERAGELRWQREHGRGKQKAWFLTGGH